MVVKPTQLLKMDIEIVDLPTNSMVIFHSCVAVYQREPAKKRKNQRTC